MAPDDASRNQFNLAWNVKSRLNVQAGFYESGSPSWTHIELYE